MPFHSFGFIFVFVPVVLAGYALWGQKSADAAKGWLVAASLVFFCWSEPRALPVLAISILFNYWISTGLGPDVDGGGRRLKLALAANLLVLVIFKYAGFASSNLNAVFGTTWSFQPLLLPLGVSFFTVQQIMFLVDRHQGVAARPRFLDYAFFVSWFPYIVAGPITRWKDVIPQFPDGKARLQEEYLARGTALFIFGLGKKVILAGAFSQVADPGFEHPDGLGFLGAWLATVSFAFQLYFDFSGYTDMARGIGLMLNVSLPENFNNPFRALNVTEYWQRWHISLTNFITSYIYTPILRARRPTFRRAIFATIVTMTIAGIWHGASWGYALFGVWHGIGLVVHKTWLKYKKTMPDALAWPITASFVLVGFAFFRAHSTADAWFIIRSMFVPAHLGGPTFAVMSTYRLPAQMFALLLGIVVFFYPTMASHLASQASERPGLTTALAVCLFICLLYMNSQPPEGFIYRQF